MTRDWLERTKANGYKAIVVTLDSQWPLKRERSIRKRFQRTRGANYPVGGEHPDAPHPAGSGAGSDPAATWKDLEWIKAASRSPIVAKGVMTGEDVELCAEVGADVVKAIALGAKAVFIGRPLFWGLAVGGEQGVSCAYTQLAP